MLIILVLLLPIESAYAQNQFIDVSGGQLGNVADDIITDITSPPSPEDMVGEDIIINVDQYQPKVIPTQLIEDQGANVFAMLIGTPTNPTIEISGINRIISKPVKITTIPPNKPVSIGAIQHVTPRREELSYDNLGYIIVPIRRIPREADVPDQIDIDMVSRIFFGVSSGLGIGSHDDVFVKEDYNTWLKNRGNHQFYAGYIRANEITSASATFTAYDNNLNELGIVTVKDGASSSIINTYRSGMISYGKPFQKFRIHVNEIRSLGNKVYLYLTRNGVTDYKVLSKGQHIFPGSSWYVSDIKMSSGKNEITLKNSNGNIETFLLDKVQDKTGTPKDNAAANAQSSAQTTPPDETLQQIVDIEKTINTACTQNKLNEDNGESCYTNVFTSIKEIADKKDISDSNKNKITTLLLRLQTAYFSYNTELEKQKSSNPQNSQDITTKQTPIKQYLAEIDSLIRTIQQSPSFKQSELTGSQALQLAKQSYQRIIDQYPKSKYAPNALYRLGRFYWLHENNIPLALQEFQRILNNYPEDEIAELQLAENVYPNSIAQIASQLSDQKNALTSGQGIIRDLQEPDGKTTTVALVNAEKALPESQSSAAIRIETSGPGQQFHVNDVLTQSSQIKWILKSINEKDIVIQATYNENGKDKTQSAAISYGQAKSIKIGPNETDTTVMQLLSTNLQREAHVTIEPATEQAFSEARYTLHLPIEKRPFGLPLFSESLDAEIAKTDSLLKKLDKIIQQASAIHETWIKLCYLTYGALWTKNLLFGGKANLARSKVNEVYKEKFSNGKLDCDNGMTFEQCIFEKHRDEYDKDINMMEDVMGEIKDDSYKQFKTLSKDYDDDQKTLYVYKRLHEAHADDEDITQKYLAALKNLQLRTAEEDAAKGLYSDKKKLLDYTGLNDQLKKGIDKIIGTMPDSKDKLTLEFYNANKEAVIRNYKKYEINKSMAGFFASLENNAKSNEKNAVDKLKNSFYMPPVTRPELPKSEIQLEKSTNTYYYTDMYGKTYYLTSLTNEIYDKQDVIIAKIGDAEYTFSKNPKEEPHKRTFTAVSSGRSEGKVEFMSIDAFYYLETTYSESGKIDKIYVYKRPEANSPMGSEDDIRVGEYNDVQNDQRKIDPQLFNKLTSAQSCLSTINKKIASSSFSIGDKDIAQCADGSYTLGSSKKSVGTSCIDFMSPSDCRILFNACDPVICPASRCNFGGDWQMRNVVQSGIIGSSLACIKNFPEVYMPVCITGIIAGLQNIRSVIAGYKECLIVAKVEGRAVGICDKIRSFGICEILWKEGIAIFNARSGIINTVAKMFGEPEGGGEYASFQQNFDNSVNTLKYFTQDYAKNVFAQYNGGSLPEIGGAICKSAIFGKVPGIGDFFDQITRPESPPQFTAFFAETPFTDITNKPMSIYNLFYHIYAGANQNIRFSIFLQTKDLTDQLALPPLYLIRSRPLPQGEFASESVSLQRPSGYQEICVEIDSPNYGRDLQCGFGKVSTSYFMNYVNEQFTKSEMTKDIDSEEKCTPTPGRITSYQYQDGELTGGLPNYPTENYPGSSVVGGAVGSFSTSFLSTGIIRKCSNYDPDVGTTANNWMPI